MTSKWLRFYCERADGGHAEQGTISARAGGKPLVNKTRLIIWVDEKHVGFISRIHGLSVVQRAPILMAVVLLTLAVSGCASNPPKPSRNSEAISGYPINSQSAIELAADFKWMPSLSGYYLPPGIYRAEAEDGHGVFFKGPAGLKLLSLTGNTRVEGGIYLPKSGVRTGRGHVYLRVPVWGNSQYFLPDKFFSAYGKTWRILPQ